MSKKMSLQEQEGWKHQERAYEHGLLAGYTKSICLVRHLQRTLVVGDSARYAHTGGQREILEKAMELISKEIKVNNNEND